MAKVSFWQPGRSHSRHMCIGTYPFGTPLPSVQAGPLPTQLQFSRVACTCFPLAKISASRGAAGWMSSWGLLLSDDRKFCQYCISFVHRLMANLPCKHGASHTDLRYTALMTNILAKSIFYRAQCGKGYNSSHLTCRRFCINDCRSSPYCWLYPSPQGWSTLYNHGKYHMLT